MRPEPSLAAAGQSEGNGEMKEQRKRAKSTGGRTNRPDRRRTPRTDGAIIKLVNLAASATSLDQRENERKSERTRVEEEAGNGRGGRHTRRGSYSAPRLRELNNPCQQLGTARREPPNTCGPAWISTLRNRNEPARSRSRSWSALWSTHDK